MAWTPPTVSDFKAFFTRDFPYALSGAPDDQNYVTDTDITKAINEARVNFNPGLFGLDDQINLVYLYLTAYYLVVDLKNSASGLASQGSFPINNISVGNVAVGYQIPERYLKSPILAPYTTNGYGMKYLTLVTPFLVGNVGIACGTTTAT